jgi:hypothetical protein
VADRRVALLHRILDAELVSQMSDGRIELTVYGAGELVPAFGVEDAVLKDALYREIMGVFLRRITERQAASIA